MRGSFRSDRRSNETVEIGLRTMWILTATILLLGYFCMGRSFAYWGFPGWHVFIGEIVLACFMLWGPVSKSGRWPWVAVRFSPLKRLVTRYLIFLGFGCLQVVHGISAGHPILDSIRDLAFNYYPIYFFLGVWIGLIEPVYLRACVRTLAWANGIYGVCFVLFLSALNWHFPGVSNEITPVPVFGQPEYSAAILVGLLAVEKDFRRVWPLFLLNGMVLIGMVIRAQWLSFAVGLLFWAYMTRNLKRVFVAGLLFSCLLGIMYLTRFTYEGPASRGGTISASDLLGRALAPFDRDAAANYTSDAQMYEDTFAFRTVWWATIWESVHENTSRSLIGYGYGFPLGDLVPYLRGESIRTPHNAFFFALGYTGWIGVLIFAAFQAEIFRVLWQVFRLTNQPFGVAFWVTMMSYSFFTAFFEAPYGAIPFYIIVGCSCVPSIRVGKPAGKNPFLPVALPVLSASASNAS